MFCNVCGKWIHDGAPFCPHCGAIRVEQANPKTSRENKQDFINVPMAYPGAPVYPVPAPQEEKGNGLAIAGFVCSFFIPLLGWIFGGVGLSRANKRNGKGKGFSIAALIIATVMFLAYYSAQI